MADNQKSVQDLSQEVSGLKKILMTLASHVDKSVLRRLMPAVDGIRIKFTSFEGRPVIGWATKKDYVKVEKQGLVEQQISTLRLLDLASGDVEEVDIPYADFALLTKIEVDVEKVSVDPKTSQKTYSFTYQGKKLELAETFIN